MIFRDTPKLKIGLFPWLLWLGASAGFAYLCFYRSGIDTPGVRAAVFSVLSLLVALLSAFIGHKLLPRKVELPGTIFIATITLQFLIATYRTLPVDVLFSEPGPPAPFQSLRSDIRSGLPTEVAGPLLEWIQTRQQTESAFAQASREFARATQLDLKAIAARGGDTEEQEQAAIAYHGTAETFARTTHDQALALREMLEAEREVFPVALQEDFAALLQRMGAAAEAGLIRARYATAMRALLSFLDKGTQGWSYDSEQQQIIFTEPADLDRYRALLERVTMLGAQLGSVDGR